MRHARHRRLGHGRVLEERGLHLAGHHVVAAPDDDLLLPAHDPEMAVGVEVAEVAALQPSVDPRARRCRSSSPRYDRAWPRAPDGDLPDFARRKRRAIGVRRSGPPRRAAGAPPTRGAVRRHPSASRSRRRTRSCRSRTGPRPLGSPAPKRRRVAAAIGALPDVHDRQAREIRRRELGGGDDQLHHGRHQERRDRTVPLHGGDPAVRGRSGGGTTRSARRAAGRRRAANRWWWRRASEDRNPRPSQADGTRSPSPRARRAARRRPWARPSCPRCT